jgi:hypothetical protein
MRPKRTADDRRGARYDARGMRDGRGSLGFERPRRPPSRYEPGKEMGGRAPRRNQETERFWMRSNASVSIQRAKSSCILQVRERMMRLGQAPDGFPKPTTSRTA